MVFSHVLVTLAECTAMAGENVDATGYVEANQQAWANQASAYLCCLCKYDLVTNVATLTAQGKNIFAEYIARYVAMCAIAYNMAGFTSRIEAEDMINIHHMRMRAIEKILEQTDIKDFLEA